MVCATWVFHIAVLTGKKHNLKVENDVLFFLAIPEEHSLGTSLSENSEELFQRVSEESRYTGIFA